MGEFKMSNKTHNLIHIEMGTKEKTKETETKLCVGYAPYFAPLKVYKDPSVVLSQDQLHS